MNIKFTLRDNNTGETKDIDWEAVDISDGFHGDVYIWESRNYSCDCNRLNLFYGTNHSGNWVDRECGDGRIDVVKAVAESGEVLCQNNDWDDRS